MACKRSPVRSRYSPPLAQIRVTNTVDFKSKSTVFLCLSESKFISILQILCKIKVEVHMDLVSSINFYPADKLADDHLFCFKAGTIVQVCVRDQFFVRPAYQFYGNITELSEKIEPLGFLRIQKSYLVNIVAMKDFAMQLTQKCVSMGLLDESYSEWFAF